MRQFLDGSIQGRKQSPNSGLIVRLTSKLRLMYGSIGVREGGLAVSADVESLDDALHATVCVRDGLGNLSARIDHAFKSLPGGMAEAGQILSAELLKNAKIRELHLPSTQPTRIRREKIDIVPFCRTYGVKIREAEIFDLKHPNGNPPQVRDGGGFLMQIPSIHQRTSKMSRLPLARMSVSIEKLRDSERLGFLHEAEAMKGIPCDCAELLAVFRHVPIEAISRLRFLEEKKAIVYSISCELNLARTRVHDMGAIRDLVSGEIHLVPHRTRFKFAFLN